MTRWGRLALAASLLSALLLVAACTGGDGDETVEDFAAERAGSRVTLGGDRCTYEGAGAVWAGPIVLEVVNDRDAEAFVEIVRLADSVTFSDLESYIAGENERLHAGREPLGEPSFVSQVASRELLGRGGGPISTELTAGRYAVLCVAGSPVEAIYATAPLEVSGATLTLTSDSCDYEGPGSISARPVSIAVANETPFVGRFQIVRIAEGWTFEDVETHVGREQERLEEGRRLSGDPDWLEMAGQVEVTTGARSTLTADLQTGDHALVCVEGVRPTSVRLAGSLEVLP